jgi:hypothetical protein
VVKGVLKGETVAVYTMSGVLVKAIKVDGEVRIPASLGGMYIVRIRNNSFKVAI